MKRKAATVEDAEDAEDDIDYEELEVPGKKVRTKAVPNFAVVVESRSRIQVTRNTTSSRPRGRPRQDGSNPQLAAKPTPTTKSGSPLIQAPARESSVVEPSLQETNSKTAERRGRPPKVKNDINEHNGNVQAPTSSTPQPATFTSVSTPMPNASPAFQPVPPNTATKGPTATQSIFPPARNSGAAKRVLEDIAE